MSSTKTIGDYSAANSIDGSTHYLLIQPGNASTAYNKINRNVLLGVTGQPVDISTAQNITNKTLDNTNTITLKDTLFTLQDDSDTTKQAKFQLSGITTATTRTYTLPNASSTLVDLSSSQTLSSKTLTAPVINNGSITGTTITTDAIVGQSVSTSGTIYGMSISSGKVGSNGVITASITDAAVTPAKLTAGTGSTWAWQSWTPAWTNLTVGNAIINAKYTQIGKTLFFRLQLSAGTTTSIGSSPTFSLPVTALASSPSGIVDYIYTDAAVETYYGRERIAASATTVLFTVFDASTTYASQTAITASIPFGWGTADSINAVGFYEVP